MHLFGEQVDEEDAGTAQNLGSHQKYKIKPGRVRWPSGTHLLPAELGPKFLSSFFSRSWASILGHPSQEFMGPRRSGPPTRKSCSTFFQSAVELGASCRAHGSGAACHSTADVRAR